MLTQFAFNELLRAIGVAEILIGDPTVVDGMLPLGATEGEMRGEISYSENNLTSPERTGGIPHESQVNLESVQIIANVVLGDPDLWEKISPTGTAGGGHDSFQPVQETSAVLIPLKELGGGLGNATGLAAGWTRLAGNGADALVGAGAAPQNAFWLWRAAISHGNVPYRFTDGGKVLVEVRLRGMYDTTKPNGHKVYTIGDPVANGIASLRL